MPRRRDEVRDRRIGEPSVGAPDTRLRVNRLVRQIEQERLAMCSLSETRRTFGVEDIGDVSLGLDRLAVVVHDRVE